MATLVYLAVPYTHTDEKVVLERFDRVNRAAANLFASGVWCFSPISHTHPIKHTHIALPAEFKFYADYDFRMIDHCDELWVLTLDGWKESIGVTAEIDYAKKKDKYVRLWNGQQPIFTKEI